MYVHACIGYDIVYTVHESLIHQALWQQNNIAEKKN